MMSWALYVIVKISISLSQQSPLLGLFLSSQSPIFAELLEELYNSALF